MEIARSIIKNTQEFDKLVHGGVPDDGRVVFVTKEKATKGGRSAVCISFGIEVDGELKTAQTVMPLRLFIQTAKTIQAGHHDELGIL